MIVKAKIKLFVAVLSIILYSASSEIPRPTIFVESTPDELQVSWTPVDGSSVENCDVVYVLSRKVNGVDQPPIRIRTGETSVTLPSSPCEENVFELDVKCRRGIVLAQARKEYFTSMKESTQVKDLVLTKENNGLNASWLSAEASLGCAVTYHLNLRIGDRYYYNNETTSNTHFFEDVPEVPCAFVALTVTPFDAGGFGQPNMVSFTAGVGDAGRIQNLEVSTNRIEWRASGDNGYCMVTYRVDIWDSGETEHILIQEEQYLEFSFLPCGSYHITIDSKLGDTRVTRLRTTYERRITNIGKVQDIEFIESDSRMLVTWSPAILGFCEIKYRARHYSNGILVGSSFAADTSSNFTSNYCAEHSTVIQVVANMITGEETEASTTASSRGPAAVENLQITKYSDSLFVTWDPIEVGFCPIQYVVQHTINDVPENSTNITETSISLNRIPCSDNNITVTAVADTSRGLPKSQFIHVSLESLEAVQNIAVDKGEGALFVSWSPIVKGQCEVFYRITNFNGETHSKYETDQKYYTIGRTNCANNTVTVVGIERITGITSDPSSYVIDVDIDLSSVQNLRVNRPIDGRLQIDWERPVGSENCLVDYLVNIIVAGNNVLHKKTDVTSLNADLLIDGCKIFEVTVTPISPAGHRGVPKVVNNTAYLFEVPSVNRLVKYPGVLTWERPNDVGICDLFFRVVVENENGLIVNEIETKKTEIDLDMVPCRNYISSVKAVDVLTNLVSELKTVEGTGKPRFIEDVRQLNYELDRETLSVTWTPAQAGDCAVSYNITHILARDSSIHVANQSQLVVPTISCSVNDLEITPSLREGVTGMPFEYRIDVGLDVLEEITNLSVSSSISNRVEWIRPAFAGNCVLTYRVHIIENNCLVHTVTTSDVFVEFNFIPCRAYMVLVTPQHNKRVGTQTELRFIAEPLAHAAPSHVRTVPSLASANVTLEVNPATVNNCPVEAIRVTCRELTGSEIVVDKTIEVQDNPERIFELSLTNLTHNTHFICQAQVLLPHESEFGQAFKFLTTEILPLRLEVSDVTSTDITVSWEVQQGLERYIVNHVLIVTTVGPNHFVQESCNVARNITEHIEVSATALSYTITNALPNFKYHISFGTRFSIGIDTFADSATVNTQASVPGPIIDLNPKFILEDCAQWSGKGFFIWTPPCDINGDLDRFEVTVGTNYTIGRENREYTESTTLRLSDADEGYVFSAPIPTLNPFFIYNVSIKIFAAFPGQDANVLKGVPAPGAYTACIADH